VKIEELYDKVGAKIYHYLTVKLGSESDAEDVLQEVFCRLARYALRMSLVRNPKAFAFRIARNEANRFLREKITKQDCSGAAGGLENIIAHSMVGPDAKSCEMVAWAIAQLPEEQREVVVLKLFEEMTFKEIAAVCDIPLNTAASRYRYGLEKIRDSLEKKI
jgi:RNA polymerase sigma-70 factor (ECF subfamily)